MRSMLIPKRRLTAAKVQLGAKRIMAEATGAPRVGAALSKALKETGLFRN